MCVYFRTKFQVSRIILTSLNKTNPKKPTLSRVKELSDKSKISGLSGLEVNVIGRKAVKSLANYF